MFAPGQWRKEAERGAGRTRFKVDGFAGRFSLR
jgi:hypothetical protein